MNNRAITAIILALAILAASSAVADCNLKIADLQTMKQKREADTVLWEKQLEEIDQTLHLKSEKVLDLVTRGDACPAATVTALGEMLQQVQSVQRGTGETPRAGGLDFERDGAFACITDITRRVDAARKQAVNDSESLKLLRYNEIANTLAALDRKYTNVFVLAKSAQMRGHRLEQQVSNLTSLCEEPLF